MTGDPVLKQKMGEGLKWVSLGQAFGYALQFGVTVVLARRLPPGNLGALSAALIFSNLAIVFNELGMVLALIQRKDLQREHKVTALWVCILMGTFFLIVGQLASSWIARFFQNPLVALLVALFACKFFVDSFGMVPEALLKRELRFRRLAFIDISFNLVYCVTAVSLLLRGAGIVSIAYGYLAASLVRALLLWQGRHFGPYMPFYPKRFRELFQFGRNILGYKMVNYLMSNMDVILIGRFLGTTPLGYYSLASNMANFPRIKLSSILCHVFFPAFSRIQEDLGHLRELYLKIVRYASVINFSLLAGLMVLAPEFVRLVFSPNWDPMIAPLRILCLYGMAFSITTLVGVVYDATGRPDYSLKFCFINLLGTTLAVSVAFRHGLLGVSVALSIYAVAANVIGHLLARRIVGLSLAQYFRSLAPAVVCCGIMIAALLALEGLQNRVLHLAPAWYLLAAALWGIGTYALGLFVFFRKTFTGMLEAFRFIVNGGGRAYA